MSSKGVNRLRLYTPVFASYVFTKKEKLLCGLLLISIRTHALIKHHCYGLKVGQCTRLDVLEGLRAVFPPVQGRCEEQMAEDAPIPGECCKEKMELRGGRSL